MVFYIVIILQVERMPLLLFIIIIILFNIVYATFTDVNHVLY